MTTSTPSERRGPKPGAPRSQASILTRRKAAELMAQGESPLDGLVDDMRWWKREVDLLETMMRQSMVAQGLKSILQLERDGAVLNFFEARKELREARLAAATYVHPRLTPLKPEEVGQAVGARELANLTDQELEQLVTMGRKITAASGAGPAVIQQRQQDGDALN